MCEGYDALRRDDDPASELDEFLCEYVDGTMDPVVRQVFDEYLRANPDVAAHAEQLRQARSVRCGDGGSCRAPRGLHAKLRRRLAAESAVEFLPRPYAAAAHLNSITLFASALAVALLLGLVAGSAIDTPPAVAVAATVQPAPSRAAVPPAAHGARALYQPALAGSAAFGTARWRTTAAPLASADSHDLTAAVRSFRATP